MKTKSIPPAAGQAAALLPLAFTLDYAISENVSAVINAADGSCVAIVLPNGDQMDSAPEIAAFIIRACNAYDSDQKTIAALVGALEAVLDAFVHIPGDDKGNKVRTEIFANCVNMRKATVQARTALASAQGGAK